MMASMKLTNNQQCDALKPLISLQQLILKQFLNNTSIAAVS